MEEKEKMKSIVYMQTEDKKPNDYVELLREKMKEQRINIREKWIGNEQKLKNKFIEKLGGI